MKNSSSIKVGILIVIIILQISTTLTQIAIGYNVKLDKATIAEDSDCYHNSEISSNIEYHISNEYLAYEGIESKKISKLEATRQSSDGSPMDSPWPMYCHDVRHTGRSPFSTVDTWDEKWLFKIDPYGACGGIVISDDGTIYFGAMDLYAVYSNGTLKWIYKVSGWIESCPAIDENGTIYVGTKGGDGNYLYAINPNSTLKWKYPTSYIYSSPVIDDDGTIYFGDSDNYYIKALYPNGTLKWAYKTNNVVYSSPAIGNDGTVYCGSHDTYLYALYPNNGTLKWKYKTGNWIRTSPCIADDGTIYVVSLDDYLHAVNPDGSFKWKTNVGAGTSPTIGQDGSIYCGYTILYAINPTNGSKKWMFDVGGKIRGGTPCNSIDGTIYLGTNIGDYDDGEIIAIKSDGNLKWKKRIGPVESSPVIGEDGVVYIGTQIMWENEGFLHAFSIGDLEADANGPYYGLIYESVHFEGFSKGGYSPYCYLWDFGDGNTSDEEDPKYIYTEPGNYTVTLTVTDNTSNTFIDITWAWIQDGNDLPNAPDINGPTSGRTEKSYPYTFKSIDPEGLQIWYYIDWGDNTNTGWLGPYDSGVIITNSHKWSEQGNYTIKAKAKDPYNAEGHWGYFDIEIPRSKISYNSLFLRFLERLPMLSWLFSFMK